MAEKVGIKEVAERCGVSKSAVSLVINNRRGVSDQTRRRIREAIDDLGFRPNAAARSLGGLGGQLVGQLAFLAFDAWADSSHSYYGRVLAGASLRAQEVGAGLSYFQIAQPDRTERLPDRIGTAELDGLLITGKPSGRLLASLSELDKPLVFVSPSTPHIIADSIRPENIEDSWLATQHLIDLGHTCIAYLGGSPDNIDAQERHLGYRMAMQSAGLALDDDLVDFQDFSPPGGCRALHNILRKRRDVTAVFAGGDYLAIGAYDAAREAGLRIPDDLSVVGFDDIEPVQHLRPALTTVQMDLRALGARAVDRALQLLSKPQPRVHLRVPGRLVVRGSTSLRTPR